MIAGRAGRAALGSLSLIAASLAGCGLSCAQPKGARDAPAVVARPPARPPAIEEPAMSKPPKPPSHAPYRQPYGNPQRNSHERVAADASVLRAPSELPVAYELTGQHDSVRHIAWLLGAARAEQLAVLGAPVHAAIVELGGPQSEPRIEWLGIGERELLAYAEDADQLLTAGQGGIGVVYMPDPSDRDRYAHANVYPMARHVLAFRPHQAGFLVMSQQYGIRPDPAFREADVTSKPYAEKSAEVHWQYALREQLSPSPVLSSGSLVMHREAGLRFLTPSGQAQIDPAIGLRQGEVLADVEAELRAGLVSADLRDQVWGFRCEDGALAGWDAHGKALGAPVPLEVAAVQPPVALPDGGLAIVSAAAVLKVLGGRVVWRAELPPSSAPLATSDASGHVFVRAGSQLVALAPDGARLWSRDVGAEITSNVLIRADGQLCVVTGFTLRCTR